MFIYPLYTSSRVKQYHLIHVSLLYLGIAYIQVYPQRLFINVTASDKDQLDYILNIKRERERDS